MSEEVHEGWNYYDLTDLPKNDYQYFRLRSEASGNGCDDIGEIHYMGYEVIDDNNDSYECKIEHVAFETDSQGVVVTEIKTDLGATVSYEVDLTPVVDDI